MTDNNIKKVLLKVHIRRNVLKMVFLYLFDNLILLNNLIYLKDERSEYSSLFKPEPAVNVNPKIQYPLRKFIWRCFVIAGIIYTAKASMKPFRKSLCARLKNTFAKPCLSYKHLSKHYSLFGISHEGNFSENSPKCSFK